jgi:hypothetical protein
MPIFQGKCAASSCHNEGHKEAGLSLGPASGSPVDDTVLKDVHDNLVNTPAQTVTTGDVMRIVPGDPSKSFLVDKITDTQNDKGFKCTNQNPNYVTVPQPCGDYMPTSGGDHLCPASRAKFDTIINWIAQGAQNN